MTEYERGFIDGVQSKVQAELTPTMKILAQALCETMQEAINTTLGNVKITAQEPYKSGVWKAVKQGYEVYVECSVCGTSLNMSDYIEDEWREILHFCPCCGARMEGSE